MRKSEEEEVIIVLLEPLMGKAAKIRKGKDLNLNKFPKDPIVRAKWVKFA